MNQPFDKPLFLGDANSPLGDWAIYSREAGIRGPYNTYLLFRGTEKECRRQYRTWAQNPSQFDSDMFQHRMNNRRTRQEPKGIPNAFVHAA